MRKLFADILIIIGTIVIIVLGFVGTGILLYMLFTHQLGVLLYTSYPQGWFALILTIVSILGGFFYSLYTLRTISVGRTTKKPLFLSFLYLFVEITRIVYISLEIKDFVYMKFFIVLYILGLAFYAIQFIGCLLNFKKRY